MSLKHSEFPAAFTGEPPILADSLDNPTAFFQAVCQLVRSTPVDIPAIPVSGNPGFAGTLLRLNRLIRKVSPRRLRKNPPVSFALRGSGPNNLTDSDPPH
jgi:hypothetical protein